MEEEEDEQPCPQAVVLSQTCWEYRKLLDQEQLAQSQQTAQTENDSKAAKSSPPHRSPSPPAPAPVSARAPAPEAIPFSRYPQQSKGSDSSGGSGGNVDQGERVQKRRKTGVVNVERDLPPRYETASLETLRLAAKGEKPNRGDGLWNVFVLVLQASGLEQITSKAGSEVDFGTLLVADQTLSFFRLTLWAGAARAGGRLIRAGDLVRLNRVAVRPFRGSVQASSTQRTSFRVVWRGDTFITPQDAPNFTMLPQGWSSLKGLGGHGRVHPSSVLSQDDQLAVSREAACALAAWAKSEFPSVTLTETLEGHSTIMAAEESARGNAAAAAAAGSLAAVRNGVETFVRACVLEVSEVERLWLWGSAGGKHRKDLVPRVTTVLTDGFREMTLQLWGDMASEENVRRLMKGSIATAPAAAEGGVVVTETARDGSKITQRPVVFEFTRLHPSFSFSCEALVLNGRSGAVKRLECDSAEAMAVSGKVLAAGAAAGGVEDRGPSIRRFESVAALRSADGFSGAGCLNNVVVRKVDTPSLSWTPSPAPTSPSCHGDARSTVDSCLPPQRYRDGALPPVIMYLDDAEESDPGAGVARSKDVEAALRVTVDGGALGDVLGCIPEQLLGLSVGRRGSAHGLFGPVGEVARDLLEGLEMGGEQGERVDVVLACSISVDANGRAVSGGNSYRLVSLRPNYRLGSMDDLR